MDDLMRVVVRRKIDRDRGAESTYSMAGEPTGHERGCDVTVTLRLKEPIAGAAGDDQCRERKPQLEKTGANVPAGNEHSIATPKAQRRGLARDAMRW
jgi:hypothetical protein